MSPLCINNQVGHTAGLQYFHIAKRQCPWQLRTPSSFPALLKPDVLCSPQQLSMYTGVSTAKAWVPSIEELTTTTSNKICHTMPICKLLPYTFQVTSVFTQITVLVTASLLATVNNRVFRNSRLSLNLHLSIFLLFSSGLTPKNLCSARPLFSPFSLKPPEISFCLSALTVKYFKKSNLRVIIDNVFFARLLDFARQICHYPPDKFAYSVRSD